MNLKPAFTGRVGVSAGYTPLDSFRLRPLRLPKPLKLRVKASRDNGVDGLDRQLKEDMERLEQRQSTVQTTSGRFQPVSIPTARTAADNADTPNFALKEAIDNFLIADFFFVVFALVSLGVSLAVNLAFESSALLDFWLKCWQWVFQPAIGLLMLGSVECCLDELLHLGGAGSAAASLKGNLAPRLSVSLSILDEHNTEFIVTLKTWQNVVSGQHRPTFVLENTSAFMQAHPMKPGDILAIVVTEANKLQLRTDMSMVELPGIGLKRKLTNTTGIAAAAAQKKRRGSVISLKGNTSSIEPSTPVPSNPSPEQSVITVSPGSTPHSSADLAAATALMFMSSDTTSTFHLKNEDSISSGISGSSSAALVQSELCMESQVTITKKPPSNRIKIKAPAPLPAKKRQGSRQGSFPSPPLPAPIFDSKKNGNNHRSVEPMVSPFQEALLSYSLRTLNNLPQSPPSSRPQQQQQQQYQQQQHQETEKSHFCFNHGPQQQHEQRQLAESFNLTSSTSLARDDLIRGLLQQEGAITRPVVRSGATVWPAMGMMNHAATIVAHAMYNVRMRQRAQQAQHMHETTVKLVQNQQHGVAIRNASTEVPMLVGAGVGGLGLDLATSHVEAFLSQLGY